MERTNLNKMTILHPFEETKILINIDKAPTKLLNSLLNKQNVAPRYIIPPMRSFGYFKRVAPGLNGIATSITGVMNSMTNPPPPSTFAIHPNDNSSSQVVQIPCAPQPTATPGDYESRLQQYQHQNSVQFKFESLRSLNEEFRSTFQNNNSNGFSNKDIYLLNNYGGRDMMRNNEHFLSRSLKNFNAENDNVPKGPHHNHQHNMFNSHSLSNFTNNIRSNNNISDAANNPATTNNNNNNNNNNKNTVGNNRLMII
jgi:hypothetical protein